MVKALPKLDLNDASSDRFFAELKETTNGMLPANIYREMYQRSFAHSHCDIIDIGVGQGPSSIAFALGIAHSQRSNKVHVIDQFEQVVDGPHSYCKKDFPEGCRVANTEVFLSHVQDYGVDGGIQTYPGRTDEVDLDPDLQADILAIDADGLIDRDLALFFDNLVPGGCIIIDDYANSINKRGRAKLRGFSHMAVEEARAEWLGMSVFTRRRILGKHFLVYVLANWIELSGAMKKMKVIGSTVFYEKSTTKTFRDCVGSDPSFVDNILLSRFLSELWALAQGRSKKRQPPYLELLFR